MDLSEELYLRFFDAARSSDHASTDVVVLNPLDVLNRLNPHSHEDRQLYKSQLADALNGLGRASARAQGLRMPITSYKRFMDSDHRLYLLVASTKPSSPEQRSTLPPACHQLVGLLKVGHKKLYLNNASGHLHECHPLCVLDFYVSESSQRKGYGRQLFEHMLRGEGVVDPCELAYDRPSPKMVAFLQRHYALVEGLPQPNNYMVFSRPSQEVPDALAPSVKSVGNLQSPTPHSPRSAVCAQKLPPLLPTTLPSVATAKLPDLRRTHSSASSGSSWHHPSTPSSASSSSMGELTRACLHWPSSATSPWHAATAESASAPPPAPNVPRPMQHQSHYRLTYPWTRVHNAHGHQQHPVLSRWSHFEPACVPTRIRQRGWRLA
ncbi:touch receptor neuron protein Mec-17-domain-containing protein [Catenaria anguillulae PL171]|uniref:Alpha-tubulin N-acetyltransferase n=1 Tax=Catenaria anguillulae PL171 TaxID=765915 RepID=A0A1Y2HQS7_9FUNG|nr:touch receptor neuron protein Mec-17-domain-containing protein [Catenaria anguillulae PL171]